MRKPTIGVYPVLTTHPQSDRPRQPRDRKPGRLPSCISRRQRQIIPGYSRKPAGRAWERLRARWWLSCDRAYGDELGNEELCHYRCHTSRDTSCYPVDSGVLVPVNRIPVNGKNPRQVDTKCPSYYLQSVIPDNVHRTKKLVSSTVSRR